MFGLFGGERMGQLISPASILIVDRLLFFFLFDRYSVDRHTDMERVFNVYPGNGSVYLQKTLDREALAWHNISIRAEEFSE